MQFKRLRSPLQLPAAGTLLFSAQLPAMAQNITPVPGSAEVHQTSATIGGSGAGATMYIECAWEVVDTTPFDRSFTYAHTDRTGLFADDDLTTQDQTLPDGVTTTGAPCVPDTAAAP